MLPLLLGHLRWLKSTRKTKSTKRVLYFTPCHKLLISIIDNSPHSTAVALHFLGILWNIEHVLCTVTLNLTSLDFAQSGVPEFFDDWNYIQTSDVHGLIKALARPEILESQSCRLGP